MSTQSGYAPEERGQRMRSLRERITAITGNEHDTGRILAAIADWCDEASRLPTGNRNQIGGFLAKAVFRGMAKVLRDSTIVDSRPDGTQRGAAA